MDILNEKYEELLSGSSNYLFKKPNMRQDSWWITTALSNVLILQELKNINSALQELNASIKKTKSTMQKDMYNDIIKKKRKIKKNSSMLLKI